MDENDDEEEMIEEGVVEDEDTVAQTEPQFKTWQASLHAQTNCMRILLKLADFMDASRANDDDDDDEEFEDCEDDDDGEM